MHDLVLEGAEIHREQKDFDDKDPGLEALLIFVVKRSSLLPGKKKKGISRMSLAVELFGFLVHRENGEEIKPILGCRFKDCTLINE